MTIRSDGTHRRTTLPHSSSRRGTSTGPCGRNEMEGAQHADARTLIDRGGGAVGGGGVGSAAGQASGPQLGCGDTITVSTKLMKDLVNCPNNGVVIGADNITFDLNGHVIDGDDAEFADCPPDEACDIGVLDFDHHGVTIKGGKVVSSPSA